MKIENLKYIDCHSHPHDKKFLEAGIDQEKMMQDLQDDGGATIAIGTDYTEAEKAILFAKKYDNCWATIGIHPADNHAEIFDEEKFERLLELGEGKVVGIGECGLDYYYFEKTYLTQPLLEKERGVEQEKTRQRELFIKQIEFAIKHDLPLIIHGRPSKNSMDAYRDILDILEDFQKNIETFRPKNVSSSHLNTKVQVSPCPLSGGSDDARQKHFSDSIKLTGHAHFFVGNLEIAKRFLDLGFSMSFDGPITFTNEYDPVIKFLPIEKIMIETDSPYAAPMPHRGKINQPQYVKFVAAKIAELKGISVEEVLEITKNNAINLFKLDK